MKQITKELYEHAIKNDNYIRANGFKNPIKFNDDGTFSMFIVGKGNPYHVLLSNDSYAKLKECGVTWGYQNKRYKNTTYQGYVVSSIGYMHRFIADCPKDKIIDHINHDTLDNRLSNIRITTQGTNMLNKTIHRCNGSRHTNISKSKNGVDTLTIVRVFYDYDLLVKCADEIDPIIKKYSEMDAAKRTYE